MIKIFDNFLSKSYHQELMSLMNGSDFDWYFNSNISYTNQDRNKLQEFGFTHTFWDSNGIRNTNVALFWKPGLLQIMDAINSSIIIRSRADMTTNVPKSFFHDPHVDYCFPHLSVVYYVNDSDGDTILYDKKHNDEKASIPTNLKIKKRVSPKANRFVAFEGNIVHTGCSPVKHKNRIIINSNFGVKND